MARKTENEIFNMVFLATGVDRMKLIGDCRRQSMVKARREFIRIAHNEGYSVSAIGRMMQRDHTSILHHLQQMPERACDDV